jgi:large subunit ribosomal protein L22
MKVTATAKFVKGTPNKARIVAKLVRGQKALYALEQLKYVQKGAAPKVRKVVQSAVANAVTNNNLKASDLVIENILISPAPTLKRGKAESKGRYRTILKRNSHITVILNDGKQEEVKVEPKSEKKEKSDVKAEKVEVKKEVKVEKKSIKKTTKTSKKIENN